jgi:WD40 repeat protein
VSNVSFSGDGILIVSLGMDEDRTVAVHNASSGSLLGRGKSGRGVDIYSLSVGGETNFITGGKNHIKFWELPLLGSPGNFYL